VSTDETGYGELISRNIVAARYRAGKLKQSSVAARMQALGHKWHPQTVGEVENARRRVTVDEILCLALTLETSVAALMEPTSDDRTIALPSGRRILGASVQASVRHVNDGRIKWDGDVPRFGEPDFRGEN
jgi:hypothetical protein